MLIGRCSAVVAYQSTSPSSRTATFARAAFDVTPGTPRKSIGDQHRAAPSSISFLTRPKAQHDNICSSLCCCVASHRRDLAFVPGLSLESFRIDHRSFLRSVEFRARSDGAPPVGLQPRGACASWLRVRSRRASDLRRSVASEQRTRSTHHRSRAGEAGCPRHSPPAPRTRLRCVLRSRRGRCASTLTATGSRSTRPAWPTVSGDFERALRSPLSLFFA